MNIAILVNTHPPEKEFSLASALQVKKSLDKLDHKSKITPFSLEKPFKLASFDLFFNLVYGHLGEDGTLPALLDYYNKPYIGPSVMNCLLTNNKVVTKKILIENNIPTPPLASLPPYIRKPISGGFSEKIDIIARGKTTSRPNKEFKNTFLENYLTGPEYCITAIKRGKDIITLPITEILKETPVFNYHQKVKSKKNHIIVPSQISPKLQQEIDDICLKCFKIFDCRFYTKIDIVLDRKFNPNVIEIDAIPGFGPKSIIPRCAAAAGIKHYELIQIFINEAAKFSN